MLGPTHPLVCFDTSERQYVHRDLKGTGIQQALETLLANGLGCEDDLLGCAEIWLMKPLTTTAMAIT